MWDSSIVRLLTIVTAICLALDVSARSVLNPFLDISGQSQGKSMQKQENSESVPDFNEGNVPKAPEPGTNLFSWDSIPDMGYGTEEKHWQVVRAAPSAGMSQDL